MNQLVCPSCQQPTPRTELVSFTRKHPELTCRMCHSCLVGLLFTLYQAMTEHYPVGTE